MTSGHSAPSLPQPPHPAAAARALAEAAQAAACAWGPPLEPAKHSRAVSQLYSTLRDLGIAARGLASYQTADAPPGLAAPDFPRHVAMSSRWLLGACDGLNGVLAAEGIGPAPDPDEPGAALCQAARNAILAWRRPSGTHADRDTTVARFITATRALSVATRRLAAYAPRRHAIGLQAVAASLTETTAHLMAAIQTSADDAAHGCGAGPALNPAAGNEPRRPSPAP